MKITEESVVVAANGQVSCELADEIVILQLDEGVYYGLNEVGREIWNLIERPTMVRTLVQTAMEKYNVEADRCRSDIIKLLDDLLSKGLVEIHAEIEGGATT